MDITQFHVKTALLYGKIQEEIYMSQLQRFENSNHHGLVCRLCKALYGLKQFSRVWNEKFSSFLREFNIIATSVDSCLVA